MYRRHWRQVKRIGRIGATASISLAGNILSSGSFSHSASGGEASIGTVSSQLEGEIGSKSEQEENLNEEDLISLVNVLE